MQNIKLEGNIGRVDLGKRILTFEFLNIISEKFNFQQECDLSSLLLVTQKYKIINNLKPDDYTVVTLWEEGSVTYNRFRLEKVTKDYFKAKQYSNPNIFTESNNIRREILNEKGEFNYELCDFYKFI